jgi:molybdopterin converting factor small subunit
VAAPPSIAVTVRVFASLRELLGADRVALDLPAGTPLGAVWGYLPSAAVAPPPGLRYAINHQWAPPGAPLADGDEVALILPVSAG